RDGRLADRLADAMREARPLRRTAVLERRHLRDVGAADEGMLPGPREDDDAQPRIARDRFDRLGQLALPRVAERVTPARIAHGDARDEVVAALLPVDLDQSPRARRSRRVAIRRRMAGVTADVVMARGGRSPRRVRGTPRRRGSRVSARW